MSQRTLSLDDSQREELTELVRSTDDANVVRRALAMLFVDECDTKTEAAQRVRASRNSLYRWLDWFKHDGLEGLQQDERGAPRETVTKEVVDTVETLLDQSPRQAGYLRSRWTTPLLAEEVSRRTEAEPHPSTIRRLLYRLDYSWTRARHAEAQRTDPEKEEKLAAIEQALDDDAPYREIFYVDEAQISLLQKVGAQWCAPGEQPTLVTPGENEVRYVIGALHADTGKVTWSCGDSHNSEFVIDFLEQLRLRYRRAQTITIIWDNASTHTSQVTQEWLDNHPKFEVLPQPTYTPSVQETEKLWKQLHEVVTRNHQHDAMDELMEDVRRFLDAVEPFPGSQPGRLKVA